MTGEEEGSAPARSGRGAVFAVSETGAGARGPVASLVSTAGWAAAAHRLLGNAWIATPEGVLGPDDARRRGAGGQRTGAGATPLAGRLPTTVKTGVKDIRQWRRAGRFELPTRGPWSEHDLAFVWQRHELFDTAGVTFADRLGVPSVLFVPATKVWEAAQWDVHRPGWGPLAERLGEAPALRAADVVACGSEVVAGQARRLGVPAERILVTPTGVDLDRFSGTATDTGIDLRATLGLVDRFVVGWVGSFRRFHALEHAVDAVAAVEGAALLLVGDGPERTRIEALARRRGVHVVCTGTVTQADLPAHLASMDAALVAAGAGQTFHYSPLKLAEYLAAGLPVVAPAVGQLADRLTDGGDALLVPPGDTSAVTAALERLRDDEPLRARLSVAARTTAEREYSWDVQVERVLGAVGAR